MYVVIREINEYDQDGVYFVAAFVSRPTKEQLSGVITDEKIVNHLLATGGGRFGAEWDWYYLIEIEEGKCFDYDNYPDLKD